MVEENRLELSPGVASGVRRWGRAFVEGRVMAPQMGMNAPLYCAWAVPAGEFMAATGTASGAAPVQWESVENGCQRSVCGEELNGIWKNFKK